MVRLFLSLPVVLSCQDQDHHLSEEHKAGKGEVAAMLPGDAGGLDFSETSRADWYRTESHCKPSALCSAWPLGVLAKYWRNERCLQVECSHTMRVELLYQLLAGEGRAFASGCILRLYLSLPIVILCSVIHPHAGLLRCEDWRQRCWPNCDRPLWKGCAQDCGQFCRTRNGGGMSQFWNPYMCMKGGLLSFKPSIKMSSRKMTVDQAGPMNPRHSYNILLYFPTKC